MKYYATHTGSESLISTKIFDNVEDACTYGRMIWHHLTDSEKDEKRVRVYLVDTGSDDLEDEIESLIAERINDGLYDEVVWDCWSYEHDLVACDIADELENYMLSKNVVVRHSSGVEATAYNYIMQELDDMDDRADELTLYKEKDWVLDVMKEKVDAVASDEVYEHDKRYTLEYTPKRSTTPRR